MTLGPGDKPYFAQPDPPSQSLEYPGVSEPLFDEELIPQPAALPTVVDNMPPRGKGSSRGYEGRWRLIAQMHARGYTNNQIGRHLGYSPSGISLALTHEFTREEIRKERDRLIDEDAIAIMKSTSTHAAKRLERAVLDPDSKNGDQVSQFLLEKVTGKAKQEIAHESGTLMAFMDMIKGMQARGEPIDITPSAPVQGQVEAADTPPTDQWGSWLDNNPL